MKKILLFIAVAISLKTMAQVKTVSLQASGLTCSMCSNAINKALKTLDFVSTVEADMRTYTFEITFKPNSVINFDLLRKKVEAAGFAVSAFIATIHFENTRVKKGQPVIVQNNTFLFLPGSEQVLNGCQQIKILDKGFISPKEYKNNPQLVSTLQTYHVSL